VLRTALRPRWLALLVVVLVAATGMAFLGQWQLDRARQRGAAAEERERSRTRPLGEVLTARRTFPGEAAGARVEARGAWDPGRQVLVAGKEQGGRTGFWVVTPLRLPDDSGVAVVRGWVASPTDPAAAASPSGTATVVGRLEPTEPPAQRAPGEASGLPEGQLDRLASTELIARWPYPLLTGYLVAESQQPPVAAPAPTPVPQPARETGLAWQNLSYAVQWWAFALFGLFFWWRLVRDDHAGTLRADPAGAGPEPVGDDEAVMAPPRRARPAPGARQ